MKRIIAGAALAALVAAPSISHAAPKVTTFYFEGKDCNDNTGVGALATKAGSGGECTLVGEGEAGVAPWSYTTKKGTSLKLDTSRKLTGTIYAHSNSAHTSLPTAAGYIEATVTFKLGSTKVGAVKVTGVTPPAGDLAVPFALALPASLKNTKVTRLSAEVTFQKCAGLCTISSTGKNVANVSVPVK